MMKQEDLRDVVRIVLFLSSINRSATVSEIALATKQPESCIADVLCQLENVKIVSSNTYREKSYELKKRPMPNLF